MLDKTKGMMMMMMMMIICHWAEQGGKM